MDVCNSTKRSMVHGLQTTMKCRYRENVHNYSAQKRLLLGTSAKET